MSITVRAAAKINLYLGVGPRQDNGFHELATVYQAIGLYDDVTVSAADSWSLSVVGEESIDLTEVPSDESNIAMRAAWALLEHHDLDRPARIDIHKGIPVAGGLAGGSADAAATLLAMDRLYDLQTTDQDLLALAAGLGSDVPFALLGGTAIGGGRGEIVSGVEDNGTWWWVVVGASGGLSTPAVYRHFDVLAETSGRAVPTPSVPEGVLDPLRDGDPHALAAALDNDLHAAALELCPDLLRTFDDGVEATGLRCLLSGSGPTVLLLCADMAHAHAVVIAMRDRGHELVWVAPAPVAGAHPVVLS